MTSTERLGSNTGQWRPSACRNSMTTFKETTKSICEWVHAFDIRSLLNAKHIMSTKHNYRAKLTCDPRLRDTISSWKAEWVSIWGGIPENKTIRKHIIQYAHRHTEFHYLMICETLSEKEKRTLARQILINSQLVWQFTDQATLFHSFQNRIACMRNFLR